MHQEDQLGLYWFLMALQTILISAADKQYTVITPSYVDNTMVLGRRESIHCYHMLKIKYCKIGLHLRVDKCEAFLHQSSTIAIGNYQLM